MEKLEDLKAPASWKTTIPKKERLLIEREIEK